MPGPRREDHERPIRRIDANQPAGEPDAALARRRRERIVAAGIDDRDLQRRALRIHLVDNAVDAVLQRDRDAREEVLAAGGRSVGPDNEVLRPVAPAMAGIGEDGRVARFDRLDKGGNRLVELAAGEILLEEDLVEALGLENVSVALSVGHGLLERR